MANIYQSEVTLLCRIIDRCVETWPRFVLKQ